jgi:decaprenylphospho-beta-D-erythro-pentofuranosid-2-ulose 2-reductase
VTGVQTCALPISQSIGEHIVRSLDKSADVVYLPWFWRYIMLIIKHIPEPIFKRMKL